MTIEAKEFKITMSLSDLWSTAFDVRHALEHSIITHWVNHQDVWPENEKHRLQRLNEMCLALGRPDLYDDAIKSCEKIISDFNKSKTSVVVKTPYHDPIKAGSEVMEAWAKGDETV